MPSYEKLFLYVSEKVAASAGDTLLHEGYLGFEAGFVLLEGEVEIVKEGKPPIIVSAPALLGEMSQFNPRAERTATVRAKGKAALLKFSWEALYSLAKQVLTPEERALLMDHIEHVVWERFHAETLMDLPLFRSLGDKLKLRVCLCLLWSAQRMGLAAGQVLFKQNSLCSGTGYLLTQGVIELQRVGEPPWIVTTPNIFGIMPKLQPDLLWTATVTAQTDAEILSFFWPAFMLMIQQRLSPDDQRQFNDNIKAFVKGNFWH